MQKLLEITNYVLGLGPTVILPIAIFILAIIFRVPVGKAVRSALTIGIGFVGINLVVGILTTNLGPITEQLVEKYSISLSTIDVGWPGAAAGSWASPVAAILIPICVLVNVIMIALKLTRTLDIDIWNYWHFIAAGATGYIVSGGSWSFSILCAVLYEVMVLLMADRTQKMVQDVYGLKGISLPTGSTAAFGFVGIPIGWLIAKIPVIKDIHIDSETIQKRFGIFGEPMPRMVKLLMEGLIPISESVRDFMKTRYKGRDLYIGLDAAVSIGHPSNISTGLILVPITLLLAIIIPGNKVLPFGDLATIPFYVSFIVASRKGNIFHSVLAGTVVIALSLLMATDFIGVHTQMMQGLEQYSHGHTSLSSLDMGGNFFNWVILKFSQLFY